MIKACVFLADGFEEVEALTVVDLLRRAQVYVDTISLTDDYMVRGSHGISTRCEELIDDVDFNDYAMVILPGGLPGTTNLKQDPLVRKVVTAYYEDRRWVAAICAAPTVFADLGILKGKRATCYPTCEQELAKASAVLTHDKVTVDGNIVTSQGMGTAVPFGIQLIACLCGKETALSIAKSIVY